MIEKRERKGKFSNPLNPSRGTGNSRSAIAHTPLNIEKGAAVVTGVATRMAKKVVNPTRIQKNECP